MEKFIQNGQVAVIVDNYSFGWACNCKDKQKALFDPTLVKLILAGDVKLVHKFIRRKYPENKINADYLHISFVNKGCRFKVKFDSETLGEYVQIYDETQWIEA